MTTLSIVLGILTWCLISVLIGLVGSRRKIGFAWTFVLTYIIHSGFISGYQNRYGDNLKPPTNVYHRMTA